MKCDSCEYDTDTQIPAGSTVALKIQLYGIHRSIKHAVQEELSLDTDHYEGCWEESQPCQGEVCRYDPEGEYDTDTARTVLGQAWTQMNVRLDNSSAWDRHLAWGAWGARVNSALTTF